MKGFTLTQLLEQNPGSIPLTHRALRIIQRIVKASSFQHGVARLDSCQFADGTFWVVNLLGDQQGREHAAFFFAPENAHQNRRTAQGSATGGGSVRNPAPAIVTALSSAWDRINAWLGRSQAAQAKAQDDEIQRMAKELQERAKEPNE